MATATDTPTKPTVTIRPFGVEADHPRNSDLMLQGIQGCRLRSRIKHTVTVLQSAKTAAKPRAAQAAVYDGVPEVPGMELHVNPAKGTYVVLDPLCDDEETRTQLTVALQQGGNISSHARVVGVPTQEGKLDPHRMKTLCREIRQWVDEGAMRVKKGEVPTMEQIDEMDGRYLLNPGAREQLSQPQFEDEFERWRDALNTFGAR